MHKIIKTTFVSLVMAVALFAVSYALPLSTVHGQQANTQSTAPQLEDAVENNENKKEQITDCDGSTTAGLQKCLKENPIVQLVQILVNFLAVGAGVIIVIMIVVGGIQYSAAGSDPQKVSAAKTRILNAIIAFFCLMFLYAFLQWLVPGGVF